jgi:hypothetical protein
MMEIFDNTLSTHVSTWHELLSNNCSDVESMKNLFEELEYTAAVDFPAAFCWEALMRAYPEAKIVHTQRSSAEAWYDSASNSIMIIRTLFPFNIIMAVVPFFRSHGAMADVLWSRLAGKQVSAGEPDFPLAHKADFIASYHANNARVLEVVPPDSLLIQDHKQGWDPLCAILQKPVPGHPYPHVNSRAELKAMVRNLGLAVCGAGVVAVAVLVLLVRYVVKCVGANKNKVA